MRRATCASTGNKGNLPHTHAKAEGDGNPRRRKQGQSGINNLPALHRHNETGRDAIQLLVTRTDPTTNGRIWPRCIQIRFRATHTNLASGRKPNKKPTKDNTAAMQDGTRAIPRRPEHTARTTARPQGTGASTVGVGLGSGARSTRTTSTTATSTWPRRGPPMGSVSSGAIGGYRSHYP